MNSCTTAQQVLLQVGLDVGASADCVCALGRADELQFGFLFVTSTLVFSIGLQFRA
jgi:hypothetical protein